MLRSLGKTMTENISGNHSPGGVPAAGESTQNGHGGKSNNRIVTKAHRQAGGRFDRLARRMVQWGFLILFLFPFLPLIYKRLSFQPSADTSSWLLPWDPLLALGNILSRSGSVLAIGAPLFLLALSLVLGRSFCGWVCPLGTLMDLVQPLAFWHRKRTPRRSREDGRRNSRLRYWILALVLGGALLSIKLLGLFDPLVIFSRTTTAGVFNLLGSRQAFERGGLTYFSLLFIVILLLEAWQPRFWCRHLCPQGALLSLVSRFSLLNRRVSPACSNCDLCKRACPMNAIPQDAHDTDYSDCTLCLECESACPVKGTSFGFGGLALAVWKPSAQRTPSGKIDRRQGEYVVANSAIPGQGLSRRQFLQGVGAVATGLAIMPLTRLEKRPAPLRPPGALPEADFLNICIACQECIRICPTHGLQAAFLQTGLAGIGMPVLVPRLGGCSLGVSCNQLCQQVCPVKAILPVTRQELKLGLAHVDHAACLAWDQGVKCLVCVEACQYQAATPYQGRVVVDPKKCVGCGFCESGCPVPGSAIHVFPKEPSTV
jgi:polyferredoxin